MSAAPIALALYEPDIAANAGAMMRTCACLGIDAAIVEPAGFPVSDRRFRRSGMDYLDHVAIERHASFERFETWRRTTGWRLVLLTTKGESRLWDFAFRPGVRRRPRRRRGRRRRPGANTDPAAASFAQRRDRGRVGVGRGVASVAPSQ
jgi:hypothetical protein